MAWNVVRWLGRICRRRSAAITLVLGIVATFSVNIPMWRSDIRDAKATLSARIDSRMTTISAELHRYEDLVTAVQSLAESDGGRIDFNSYQAFAAHLLREREGIQALNYTPRVTSSEREAFEATARREGVADFHMTEIGPDGRPATAGVRDEYFPIYDMYPLTGNEIALGLDGLSYSEALFERARDSGEIAASAPLRLVGQEDDWGTLVVGPVYSTPDTTTVEQRRTRLEGYAIGVFRVGEVFESILRNSARLRGYDHYIFDGPPITSASFSTSTDRDCGGSGILLRPSLGFAAPMRM